MKQQFIKFVEMTQANNIFNPTVLSPEEIQRYSRHIQVAELGMEGQLKLKQAKVLIVGSGGLGSPVLLYLAAAGVGTIGIIDFDRVDVSNLQRQILFNVNDIGESKAKTAQQKLNQLNPHIQVKVFDEQLTRANARAIINQFDVVVDGSDNFQTRYLVNDACVLESNPLVFGSILQFTGQLSVFNALNELGERGPNYCDLYPTQPEAGSVPSCTDAGVLGVLPGIIGTMQANEVIKLLTGIGETLSGRLVLFDALKFEFRTIRYAKNPEVQPITELIDYNQFCGLSNAIEEIDFATYLDLKSKHVVQLIDVRELHEFQERNLGGLHIPLNEISNRADELNREALLVIHCKSGRRSAQAIQVLQNEFGFSNLLNLKGGIDAVPLELVASN